MNLLLKFDDKCIFILFYFFFGKQIFGDKIETCIAIDENHPASINLDVKLDSGIGESP